MESNNQCFSLYFVYLSKSFPCFIFRDVALSDVLLEWREEEPEQGDVLPKQASCGNATRVKGSKYNTCILVEAPVEFLHGKHIADFAVLVGLSPIKVSSIDHG